VGNRCADHVTPLYPQKLALTSPTGGGRSVGIVRSRTEATEFSLVFYGYTRWTHTSTQINCSDMLHLTTTFFTTWSMGAYTRLTSRSYHVARISVE